MRKTRTLKIGMMLVVCLIMLACAACGNSERAAGSNASDTTTVSETVTENTKSTDTITAAEEATETASTADTTDQTIDFDSIMDKIEQYKEDFKSGKWDGSPIFVGENVISIDTETGKIWINNDSISEPLYCTAAENETYYVLDQDDTYMYYYKDVESEQETKYFILQVNKTTGDTVAVEVPESYSAKLALENVFVRGEYSLYRIDFTVENPEAILIEECISDFEVVDFYSSVELHYITGNRKEGGISIDKESHEEKVIEPHDTARARYSAEEGEITFYDNDTYSKARELYESNAWDGKFIDLHEVDESIPENTFADVDYDGNIIINNKVEGRYYRAMQVESGCNVFESYYGSEVIYFEEGFNEELRFYFPGQKEDYRVHSYGTTLPSGLRGYTRMIGFYYESDLTDKVAGARVYILTDGELWFLDCNFITEQVETKIMEFDDHEIIDFNWAYDSLYYLLDNGEAYTISYGEVDWDFDNPERFGGDKLFYALSHHTDEREGALSFNEGNYGDSHLYSPYGEDW